MALLDDVYALIRPRGAAIGTVIPGIVVREVLQDETGITAHPVETGAAVTDHAFLVPARVEMVCGWSDSTAGYAGYVDMIYEELLALRNTREPFTVSTGFRNYDNMLIRALTREIDDKNTNSLFVAVSLQQIIITNTQGGGGTAPNAAQADPSTTGSTVDTGTQSAIPQSPAPGSDYSFSSLNAGTLGSSADYGATIQNFVSPTQFSSLPTISPGAGLPSFDTQFGQYLPTQTLPNTVR